MTPKSFRRSIDYPRDTAESEMRERCSVHGGPDQHRCVRIVFADWSVERHAVPPTGRRLGVNAAEGHAPAAERSIDDGGRAVRILRDDRTPTFELRTVLPVLIQRSPSGDRDGHGRLADTVSLGTVEGELHAGRQLQCRVAWDVS